MRLSVSIWSISMSVVRPNWAAKRTSSGGASSPAGRKTRWRCWTESFIGISGFLISCATWRAISDHASSRSCAASRRRLSASCDCIALKDSTSSPTSSCVSTGMGGLAAARADVLQALAQAAERAA